MLPERRLCACAGLETWRERDIFFFLFCVIERHWKASLRAVIRIILHVSEILSVCNGRIYNPLHPFCFSSDPLEMCTEKIPLLPCFVPGKKAAFLSFFFFRGNFTNDIPEEPVQDSADTRLLEQRRDLLLCIF